MRTLSSKELQDLLISKGILNVEDIHAMEITVPIDIFRNEVSPLQAVVLFLLTKKYALSEISKLLRRPISTIKKAVISFDLIFETNSIAIPISAFQTNLSILETVALYLSNNGHKLSSIAALLNRNPKTIWTHLKRAKDKYE
jgi:hypothetical protein